MPLILGITATGKSVSSVLLEKIDDQNYVLLDSTSFDLQAGERAQAYQNLAQRFSDYVAGKKIDLICVKSSASSGKGGATDALLEGAEVRGVILAAAAATGASVLQAKKATISKSFGERKVEEYCGDSSFWSKLGLSSLKKGMRETALFAIAQAK